MTDTTTDAPEAQTAEEAPQNNSSGLAGLKLAQLKALASQLGIAGSSRMRKSDLVDAISAHQRGGAVADRDAQKKKDQTTSEPGKAESDKPESDKADRNGHRDSAGKDSAKQDAEKQDAKNDDGESADTSQREQSNGPDGKGNNRHRRQRDRQRGGDGNQDKAQQDKGQENRGSESSRQNGGSDDRQSSHGGHNQQNDSQSRDDNQQGGGQQKGQQNQQPQQHGGDNDDDRGGRNDRRNRRRNRNDRNRRGRDRQRGPDHDDTEVTDEDQLIPIAGIVDVLDNYAFVRTSGYLPGQNDVYVSLQQVKKNRLRKGDVVTGFIKAPGENQQNQPNQQNQQRSNKRQKFAALVKVEKVNGRPVDDNTERVDFGKLTPLYPQERLRLESGDAGAVGPRVIDLISPIGKGQRGLIVSPPKAGKTMILQSVAHAIKQNNPEVHLMMVLVDERPEEVTDMQRSVDGEVIASTFDRPADDHTTVAELAIERAKRLVELGKDVVILLDSMTRLGRAYNQSAPASGRILSGGVDAAALYPPKRFFGAARNIENGGSLTILATALVETGSKMDEVIFEEFKGTGNMELRLSRQLSDRRIFPAVDVNASSTRREEALLSPEEIKIMWRLRRVLSGLDQQQGLELLINKLKETKSNAEFLMLISKTTLGGKNEK
ncbi:MAG: transcription termination factor Rho [Nesterenkonia sp.]